MTTMRFFRPATLLITLLFGVGACGGGGGGGPATPTPPAPPPSPRLSVSFTSANAENGAVVALSLSEGILQISGLAFSAIAEVSDSGTLQFGRSCPNGGLVDFVLTDVDQDARPSPGDFLRITYRDCELVDLNGVATGDVVIELAQPAVAPAVDETVFAGSITPESLTITSGQTGSITIDNSFSFEVRKGRLFESIVSSGDTSFTINEGNNQATESIQGFVLRKDLSFEDARYTLQMQGLFDSSILGGTFEFDDSLSISGFFNTYPEQGRLELIGRDSTRVAVTPNFVTGSSSVNIDIDTAGNGNFAPVSQPFWSEIVEGFLWWYKDGSPFEFQARPFDVNDFFIVVYAPGLEREADVNTEMRIQFSRRVDPASVPTSLFALRQFDDPPFSDLAELDLEIAGAALMLRPRAQLRHGHRYFYPSQFFNAEDEFQNSTAVFGTGFLTPDTLSSQPTTSTALAVSGDTIALDGSSSVAIDSSIVSFAWTQISGTMGQFNTADQSNAEFIVPALAGAETIELQLEVTNVEGEYDRETIEISAFESQQTVQVISFSGDDTDFISAGRDWLLTSANGRFSIGRNFDNGLTFVHDRTEPSFSRWNIEFAAAGNSQIEVGAFENATRFPFQAADSHALSLFGDGRGCNTVTGRFDVFEISYDANGVVQTAAIDFEQHCEGGADRAYGSIRIGSSIPIPGQ